MVGILGPGQVPGQGINRPTFYRLEDAREYGRLQYERMGHPYRINTVAHHGGRVYHVEILPTNERNAR